MVARPLRKARHRPLGDQQRSLRPAPANDSLWVVKLDHLNQIRVVFDPVLTVDDNAWTVAMWIAAGVETVAVPGYPDRCSCSIPPPDRPPSLPHPDQRTPRRSMSPPNVPTSSCGTHLLHLGSRFVNTECWPDAGRAR
jgi:hypothetical protein